MSIHAAQPASVMTVAWGFEGIMIEKHSGQNIQRKYRMTKSICNECETVAHCTKNGCIPKQPSVDLRTAAQQALEALEYYEKAGLSTIRVVKSITALRQALEQPAPATEVREQEPVPSGYTERVIQALYENGDLVSVDAAEELERLRAFVMARPEVIQAREPEQENLYDLAVKADNGGQP